MNLRVFCWLACVGLALAVTSCSQANKPQSQAIDDHTTVTLKGSWIFGTTNQLLRAQFDFLGDNPSDKYDLKAGLSGEEQGEDIQSNLVWYVGLTPQSDFPTNRIKMFWEFKFFPTNTPYIYLHQYYIDKSTAKSVKTLNFVLPGFRDLPVRDGSSL